MITKPMLAGKCSNPAALRYPALCTPKLDGIRCLVIGGKAVSRKFLSIPNNYIRQTIELSCNSMVLDGEIMIPNRSFNELSGDVRRIEGRPTDFKYHVFDYIAPQDCVDGYRTRMQRLAKLSLPAFCKKVLPVEIKNEIELQVYERDQLALGYEGVMIRLPDGPYKCGRSSEREGYLLKLKQFEDSEAVIVDYEPWYENQNIAERDAFGRTKRSSCQDNLVAKEALGKLVCRTDKGVEFGIGTGFDMETRNKLWAKRDELKGKLVKYKHQPSGADERPRFPVFLGFRDAWDV